MRLRFFLIILSVLLTTLIALSFIQDSVLVRERRRLIDQQIERMASSLYSSDLSTSKIDDVEEAADIVSEVLGEPQPDSIIRLYSRDGSLIYQSEAATQIGNLDTKERWQRLERDGHTIRVLTLPLPDSKETLQVGLFLDGYLLHWRNLKYRIFFYLASVLIVISGVSYALMSILLRPLTKLAQYLEHETTLIAAGTADGFSFPMGMSDPGERLQFRWSGKTKGADEISRLAIALNRLGESAKLGLKRTNQRITQMTHELKTPLTIIRNTVETVKDKVAPCYGHDLADCLHEIDKLSQTINHFMEWSRFESVPGVPQIIHANSLGETASQIAHRMEKVHPGRIHFESHSPGTVFSMSEHFEQVITNLLSNALQYSESATAVELIVEESRLIVRDKGPGIPATVLQQLGTPFNTPPGQRGSGTGLGLAWVHAICRKYGWRFAVRTAPLYPLGTEVIVDMAPP